MAKVIAITLSRRPGYTLQVLYALSKCYSVENFTVLFSLDWNDEHAAECSRVLKLVDSWTYSPSQVFVNSPRLGVDENKLFIARHAYEISPFVIFLEDDMVPARDFLQYMVWNGLNYADDPTFLSVCGYNRHDTFDTADLYKTWRDHCFHAWGWGMWRKTWDQLFENNAAAYRLWAGDKVNGLFDHYLAYLAREKGLWTIKPVVARVQNIGQFDGEHASAESFALDHNPRGAWEVDLPEYWDKWTLK